MKTLTKILSSIALLLVLSVGVMAQVPQGFNFQAVASAPDGTPLSSVEIGVQIEVVKGTEEGDIVYTETHTVTTNAVGLFQIVIGEGTPSESNDFSTINWGNDNYFVGFGVDLTGTGTFESLGKSRLLSVPYALIAQDVVNGSGMGGDITEYELNVSSGDTAFTVFMTGDEGDAINPAIKGYANTVGFNIGVDGIGESVSGNETFQYGVRGIALGEGTGLHYGLRGEARASGAWNIGVRGQSIWESTEANYGGWFSGRNSSIQNIGLIADANDFNGLGVQYNTGVVAQAFGPGNGNPDGNGSHNVGVRAEALGNTWVNEGIVGIAFGEVGTFNNGIVGRAEVNDGSETIRNTGVIGEARGSGTNIGIHAFAENGTENIAGLFEGQVVVNGDLTVNGTINGEVGGSTTDYNLDASTDTAFTVRISGDEGSVNNSAIIGEASTFGTNVGVEGKAISQLGSESLQVGTYGEAIGDGTGTHIAVYGWASAPERTGGSSYGLFGRAGSLGKFNQGARTFVNGTGSGEIVPIGDPEEENGNFGSFNIGYSTYVEGNNNGNTGLDIEIGGDQGSRINIGAEARVFTVSAAQNSGYQAIVNGSSTLNRGFWGLANGDNENVGMELIAEGGTSNTGLIVSADVAAVFNGVVDFNDNSENDQFFTIGNGGFSGGTNPYTDGIVINHNGTDGSVFEMYDNGNQTININGGGSVFFSGALDVDGGITTSSVNETSDRRLKTNIEPLNNSLENTLNLRGVSYNWVDENRTQDHQIGVIAQEVEVIYPEFVHTDDKGMKSVNYSQMVAVLIEAVKELNAKVEVLETENSELQAQVDDIETMKTQINSLMKLISTDVESESISADK